MVGQIGNNTVNTQYSGVASANNSAPNTQTPVEQPTAETVDTSYTVEISDEAQALANADVTTFEGATEQIQAALHAFAAETSAASQNITTVEGSFLLNFSRGPSNLRDHYFRLLFSQSNERANTMMLQSNGLGQANWHYNHTLESSIARHAELRDEVYRAFGHDSGLLAANLDSLDRAFEGHNMLIAWHISSLMSSERAMSSSRDSLTWDFEPNALANHRSFNRDEFENHAREMMGQLSRFHLQQVNSGVNPNDAFRAAMNFTSGMFGMTTSVNNLSFNDFMFTKTLMTSGTATTGQEAAAMRDRINNEFNNSTQLSPELRELLGR
ncbi:MAG: hypothetical protein FWC13_13115 [Oscillospiraceae bacterium]|nr:hypothetical protein [Oscillospiraceae bacterium]